MSNKTMNKMERYVLKAFVTKEIGDIGYYLISDENHVFFTIDYEKLSKKCKDKSSYKLNLPTIDKLKEKIKAFYPFFDEDKLQKIVYVLKNSKFDKEVEITTNADIIIHNCTFDKGLIVMNAKRVSLTPKYYVNNDYNTNVNVISRFIINADEIEFEKCNLNFLNSAYCDEIYVNINVKKVCLDNSSLVSSKRIEINTDILNSKDSVLEAPIISINTDKIESKNDKLVGSKLISINNKSCTPIENVYAPKILYNGKDITQPQEIQLPKARLQLIEALRKLKDKCDNGIIEETISYQESLEKQPLLKRFKK